jgi:hypothetical protein
VEDAVGVAEGNALDELLHVRLDQQSFELLHRSRRRLHSGGHGADGLEVDIVHVFFQILLKVLEHQVQLSERRKQQCEKQRTQKQQ